MPAGDEGLRAESQTAQLWMRVGLPGLVASAALATGALAVGWLAPASPLATDPVLTAVRDSPAGNLLGKALLIAGAAGSLRVWLGAVYLVRGLSVSQARLVGAFALVWAIPVMVAPVVFSRDVFSYISLSRLGPAGLNPYEEGTGALFTSWFDGADPLWHHSPSPYGPLWTLLSSWSFHLTGADPVTALLAFRLLALVGLALMVFFVPRLAELAGGDPGWATWLAVLNPLVLFHVSSAAHNDALMVGLVVAGLALALSRRPVAAVVLVSAAGAVKAPALVLLPFIGIAWAAERGRTRSAMSAWVRVAMLSIAVLAGLTWLSGHGLGWIGNMSTPTKVDTWLSPVTAMGRVVGLVADWMTPLAAADVLAFARAVGALAGLVLVAVLALTHQRRSDLRGGMLAVLTVVLLGPVVHPWYLLWVLPLAAALPLRRWERRVAVATSVCVAVYSVANTSATTESMGTVPGGIVILASVVSMALIGVSPRLARQALNELRGGRLGRWFRLGSGPSSQSRPRPSWRTQ